MEKTDNGYVSRIDLSADEYQFTARAHVLQPGHDCVPTAPFNEKGWILHSIRVVSSQMLVTFWTKKRS